MFSVPEQYGNWFGWKPDHGLVSIAGSAVKQR